MSFAQILQKLMKERGYTNYRLAKLLDCSQSTVASWVNGNSVPSRSRKKQISELFDVSVEYLDGNENPAPTNGNGTDDAILRFLHSLPIEKLVGILTLVDAPKELIAALGLEERKE